MNCSTTRRVRLHGRVAEALEALYADRADRHAAELAQHYGESATLTRSHAGKAARYTRLAAEQAEAASAWDEAARQYEACLAIIGDAPDRLGEDDAAIYLALGVANKRSRSKSPHDALDRSLALYRARDDAAGVAATALAMASLAGATMLQEQTVAALDAALAAVANHISCAPACWSDSRWAGELEERRSRHGRKRYGWRMSTATATCGRCSFTIGPSSRALNCG